MVPCLFADWSKMCLFWKKCCFLMGLVPGLVQPSTGNSASHDVLKTGQVSSPPTRIFPLSCCDPACSLGRTAHSELWEAIHHRPPPPPKKKGRIRGSSSLRKNTKPSANQASQMGWSLAGVPECSNHRFRIASICHFVSAIMKRSNVALQECLPCMASSGCVRGTPKLVGWLGLGKRKGSSAIPILGNKQRVGCKTGGAARCFLLASPEVLRPHLPS